jgi:hypothetical protein
MDSGSLDPASATATDVLQAYGIPVQSVSYKAGLVQPFTGPSTLNPPIAPGSGLPLRNTANETAVSDFIESFNPGAAQDLSGVSTPPFMSAQASMPDPEASPLGDTAFNAMQALSKFGVSLGILLGLHPVTSTQATGQGAAQVTTSFQVSGAQVAIMGIVATALIILLLKNRGE